MFIQAQNYARYGLEGPPVEEARLNFRVGDRLFGAAPFKVFNKAEMLEEIEQRGFMSDFHPLRADLMASPEEEILAISDPQVRHGEIWFVCCTTEANRKVRVWLEANTYYVVGLRNR